MKCHPRRKQSALFDPCQFSKQRNSQSKEKPIVLRFKILVAPTKEFSLVRPAGDKQCLPNSSSLRWCERRTYSLHWLDGRAATQYIKLIQGQWKHREVRSWGPGTPGCCIIKFTALQASLDFFEVVSFKETPRTLRGSPQKNFTDEKISEDKTNIGIHEDVPYRTNIETNTERACERGRERKRESWSKIPRKLK